jgi:hypothetical protein
MPQETCRDTLMRIDTYLYNLREYMVSYFITLLCFVSILYDRHLETQKHKNKYN